MLPGSKQAEKEYLRNLGELGPLHSLNKPFSDPNCPRYLAEISAVFRLLPPPPARLLDVGCGAGWTSVFLARRGYDVTGVDIAEDMIRWAEENRRRYDLPNLRFLIRDFEEMNFHEEFDAVLFFDSLHHARDEHAVIRNVFTALKDGGVCIASEPGHGHSRQPASIEANRRFGVTERDMPPLKLVSIGEKAGFRRFDVFPHAADVLQAAFGPAGNDATSRKERCEEIRSLLATAPLSGIVRMFKDAPNEPHESNGFGPRIPRRIRRWVWGLLCRLLWK
jgi:SAM-dependent methyltransferase